MRHSSLSERSTWQFREKFYSGAWRGNRESLTSVFQPLWIFNPLLIKVWTCYAIISKDNPLSSVYKGWKSRHQLVFTTRRLTAPNKWAETQHYTVTYVHSIFMKFVTQRNFLISLLLINHINVQIIYIYDCFFLKYLILIDWIITFQPIKMFRLTQNFSDEFPDYKTILHNLIYLKKHSIYRNIIK